MKIQKWKVGIGIVIVSNLFLFDLVVGMCLWDCDNVQQQRRDKKEVVKKEVSKYKHPTYSKTQQEKLARQTREVQRRIALREYQTEEYLNSPAGREAMKILRSIEKINNSRSNYTRRR